MPESEYWYCVDCHAEPPHTDFRRFDSMESHLYWHHQVNVGTPYKSILLNWRDEKKDGYEISYRAYGCITHNREGKVVCFHHIYKTIYRIQNGNQNQD